MNVEDLDVNPFLTTRSVPSPSTRNDFYLPPNNSKLPPTPNSSPRCHTSTQRTLPIPRESDVDFIKQASAMHKANLADIGLKPPLSPPVTSIKSKPSRARGSRAPKGFGPIKQEDGFESISSASCVKPNPESSVAHGLLTPPRSTRKAPRHSDHVVVKDERVVNSSVSAAAGSSYQLPTPDSSPVKERLPPFTATTKASRTNRAPASMSWSLPKAASAPRPGTVFLPWTPADHGIVGIDKVEMEQPDGTTLVTLKAKNGDLLKWYQSVDVKDIVNETLTRDDMAREDDPALKEIPQGRILGYEMGLGKTHVACAVVVEHTDALKARAKRDGSRYRPKPVLVVCDKTIQEQWNTSLVGLSGDKYVVSIYEKGRKPLPLGQVIIANIVIIRNMFKRYLDYWERRLKLYQSRATGEKPDPVNPTPDDLAFLRIEAPFYITEWRYLIVDEFHSCIANPTTLSAQALLGLKVQHYLLLSGTPAQNKLDNMLAAVALLQHPSKRHNLGVWEAISHLASKSIKPQDVVHLHVITEALISQIMITRRIDSGQEDVAPLIELPERIDYVVSLTLTAQEAALERLMSHLPECVRVKILRRRQACLHPWLLIEAILKMYGIKDNHQDEDLPVEVLSDMSEDKTEAFGPVTDSGALVLDNPSERRVRDKMAELNTVLDDLGVKECFEDRYLPSKIKVATGIVKRTLKERKEEKIIIFSMFTSLLEIFSGVLDNEGMKHALFTGKKSRNERERALRDIGTDPHCSIILISMKAGGTGLNITACNNVIILDPWWNPYVEEQAISRVYRIGQGRGVHVYRILAPNTIEKNITDIQDSKRRVIDSFTDDCAKSTTSIDITRHVDPRYLV